MSSSLAGRATPVLFVAAVSLLVLVAACDRESRTTTTLGTGNHVTVIDRTAWFEGVRVARSEFPLPRQLGAGVSIEVRDTEWPRIPMVRWVTGGCHEDPTIELDQADGRLLLKLWAGPPCANQQYGIRSLELVFDRPVPADTVDPEVVYRYRVEPVASATP